MKGHNPKQPHSFLRHAFDIKPNLCSAHATLPHCDVYYYQIILSNTKKGLRDKTRDKKVMGCIKTDYGPNQRQN